VNGGYDLKGFADPVPIYLLAWEDALDAPADEPAQRMDEPALSDVTK